MVNNVRIPSRWSFGISLVLPLFAGLSSSIILSFLIETKLAVYKYTKPVFWVLVLVPLAVSLVAYFERIQTELWSSSKAVSGIKTDNVKELYTILGNDLPLYRFYALGDLIPANIGNIYFN